MDNSKKKKILVTGGTGYIGSHTVVELQESGFDVIIVDNLSNSEEKVVDSIEKITNIRPEFENIDLADKVATDSFFDKHNNIEAIIHFAAYKAVGESVQQPLKYYDNNINSLINLLNNMERHNISNFVFSSSCTVYGQPDTLPVTEETPRKEAESPYGNTKAVSEDIIRDFSHINKNIKSIALRYFNPIGAHPTGLIGELPIGVPNNLVPFITQTAAGLRDELSIFGDDYNTPDGTAIRDYINVVDLAQAHVVAINRLINNKQKNNYEFFNVGTGNGLSVMELVKSFIKVTGVDLPYKITDRRTGDIEKIWADTSYANRELGWEAKKDIDETLLSAWVWEKNIRNL